jgi:cytochrome P450
MVAVPTFLEELWQNLPTLEKVVEEATPTRVAAVLVLMFAARFAIRSVLFAPLRHIKGPFVRRFTNIPYVRRVLAGRQLEDYQAYKDKYGTVARMGANIVSVTDPSALSTIYGSHKFCKGAVYDTLNWFGSNIFSTRDPQFHKKRRHAVYPAYSQAALKAMEGMLYESGPKALADYIERYAASGEAFDLLQELQLMRANQVGVTSLGQNFGLLEARTAPLLDWVGQCVQLGLREMYFPILRRIRLPFLYGDMYKARQNLYDFVLKMIEARRKSPEKPRDILQTLLDARDPETGEPLTDDELVSEVAVQFVVGNFPVSLTILWTIYLLMENPDALKRLLAELDEALPAGEEIDDNKLAHLPYLEAVLRESMRHRPVMAEGLPRVVPKGGCVISGQKIPEGTVVFASSFILHHDPKIWSEPEVFRPERWLGPPEQVNEMKKAYFPFSIGPRSCVGQRMAWMLMRTTLVTLLRRYNFEPLPNQNMAPTMQIFMVPAGGKYMVRAAKRV